MSFCANLVFKVFDSSCDGVSAPCTVLCILYCHSNSRAVVLIYIFKLRASPSQRVKYSLERLGSHRSLRNTVFNLGGAHSFQFLLHTAVPRYMPVHLHRYSHIHTSHIFTSLVLRKVDFLLDGRRRRHWGRPRCIIRGGENTLEVFQVRPKESE